MNAIELTNIKKVYKGGVEALKGISLAVKEGDFYALLGPNGAGKSTTIGIISSLVNKTSGTVSIFGFDLSTQLEQAKQQIGLVPQEFNFNQFEPPLQILVNQAGYYGIKRRDALVRAERFLKQLDLWEKRDQPARELSGGMKRRLMIARALMHEPRLLILDEPTAGVDIEVRRSMWEFLQLINKQGVTIILTTHYLEEAEMLCRNIGIIDKGNLVENTSMKSLLARLATETFIFDVDPPTHLPSSNFFTIKQTDEVTLEIELDKEQSLNKVFSELSAQGIRVNSMRNKANRLEELFIELVEKGSDNVKS
ncbi:ABC transporter [Psychromonas sp. psych-6C06]|uniref:ABC transporter ATP-binding protein n=1 Tax=Psychromonas sp. psych-6C06 TaxID=2058089 RepID=UPI000C3360BF|nr:ABC transporter ATP-binding protein [Psychromonas sp. psych-6C06]PKF61302.1 ABC transporter [Psychromonas sp. psych-6C06]